MHISHAQTGYTTLDGRYIDSEKRTSSDYLDSSSSSGDESGSLTGLLSRSSSPRRRHGKSFSYAVRRRRFTRYFTLVVASCLVGLVLLLTHLKSISEAMVRSGQQKMPPPPPPWEEFPFLKRYHGGVRKLVPRERNKPEYPDRERELEIGEQFQNQSEPLEERDAESTMAFDPMLDTAGDVLREICYLDVEETLTVPPLQMHLGVPEGMPDPVIGSYDVLGLQNTGCFDRYGRLGPYGLGYTETYGGTGTGLEGEGREEALSGVWKDSLEIDYTKVDWATAQARCFQKNKHRFRDRAANRTDTLTTGETTHEGDSGDGEGQDASKIPRTAVLIRTWLGFEYDTEDIMYLRALANEVSLQSGGEYSVHFLVHVKDDDIQIWADDDVYQQTLAEALPAEFRGMGTLWSERQMGLIYGGIADSMFRNLPVHGVYRSTYMPVQYFAHTHPEYDYFWHWEMDVRYIGHYYHLFNRLTSWAKEQPRKGLWERNGRFYIPSEHGSWEDFLHMTRVQTEHGTANRESMYHNMVKDPLHPGDVSSKPEVPVWGPVRAIEESDHFENETDVTPPSSPADDKYTWGVGEEADLITLNPLFDPDRTTWLLAEDVTGYNTTDGLPPRRASIITSSRLSRKLLLTMHRETALAKHTMSSEMWPSSCALHHGYKAVYAPHPVYIDRRWPTSYLAAIFNNGKNGASGGSRGSIWSEENHHNFLGTTWFYRAGFPENLWKRWLGYKVDNDGGEQEEKALEGRMCLPSMLLHPVKHVDMVYEPKDEVLDSSAEGDLAS